MKVYVVTGRYVDARVFAKREDAEKCAELENRDELMEGYLSTSHYVTETEVE